MTHEVSDLVALMDQRVRWVERGIEGVLTDVQPYSSLSRCMIGGQICWLILDWDTVEAIS